MNYGMLGGMLGGGMFGRPFMQDDDEEEKKRKGMGMLGMVSPLAGLMRMNPGLGMSMLSPLAGFMGAFK